MNQSRDTRSPGRPRRPETGRAILDAAIVELAQVGYEALSFEAVAARSGSSRSTIYRRYRNKAELVVAAVGQAFERANPEAPDTGDVLADVTTLVYNTARMLVSTPVGGVIRAIVFSLPRDHALSELAAGLERQRRKLLTSVLERGVRAGQLGPLDVDKRIDAMLGAVYLRFLLLQKPVHRRYVEGLVRQVLMTAR